MAELNVTRRAVLYGTAASLAGTAIPRGVEAEPAIAAPMAATVDFEITVNGEPLLVTAEPTLLGRLGHTLGLSSLPQPVPLVARCDPAEMSALPAPPVNGSGR